MYRMMAEPLNHSFSSIRNLISKTIKTRKNDLITNLELIIIDLFLHAKVNIDYKLREFGLYLFRFLCPSVELKYLELDFKPSLAPHEKLSNFFIFHGLMYLPQLQHVRINRHTVSSFNFI